MRRVRAGWRDRRTFLSFFLKENLSLLAFLSALVVRYVVNEAKLFSKLASREKWGTVPAAGLKGHVQPEKLSRIWNGVRCSQSVTGELQLQWQCCICIFSSQFVVFQPRVAVLERLGLTRWALVQGGAMQLTSQFSDRKSREKHLS